MPNMNTDKTGGLRVLGVILARGGSTGIPLKNVKPLGGRPLIDWCLQAAIDSGIFTDVYVSTDHDGIAECATSCGAKVHRRSTESATNSASSELGMMDFANQHDFDVLCLIQATSPLTQPQHFEDAFAKFQAEEADSLVTVVRSHRFLWREGEDGLATAVNYDPMARPLRQNWDGELFENGAFYFTRKELLDEHQNRLGGKMVAYEMPEYTLVELDSHHDWHIMEGLITRYGYYPQTALSMQLEDSQAVNLIAEIGINHNGDMEIAKQLIMTAKLSGCQFAKIQKRTPDICVPEHQKSKMRKTPWGEMTYLEYKKRMEFDMTQVKELVDFGEGLGITFFASVWDIPSCDDMAQVNDIAKIPSALITDLELCRYARQKFSKLIISTGMSTEEEVEECINACKPDIVMHTNSTYPCPVDIINMNYMVHLKQKYPSVEIGYSGHEDGLTTSFAAVAMGATWVERHITLDRSMWGSDQSSSVEPAELFQLVKGIREIEACKKYPAGPRRLFKEEASKRDSLRPTSTPVA
jgi:N-acetylneuraminate synthase